MREKNEQWCELSDPFNQISCALSIVCPVCMIHGILLRFRIEQSVFHEVRDLLLSNILCPSMHSQSYTQTRSHSACTRSETIFGPICSLLLPAQLKTIPIYVQSTVVQQSG